MKSIAKFSGIGLGLLLSFAAAACSSGGGSSTTQPGAGVGNSFTLVSVKWGRLVDVYDKNNSFYGKFVINQSQTSSSQVTLSTNALTGHSDLKVLNFAKTDGGFLGILNSVSNQLASTVNKGPTDTFGFSMIPRNAGVRLQFSKNIDPLTLNPNTVKVRTGSPPNPPTGIPFDLGTLELDPRDSSAVIVSGVVLGPENIALGINLNPTGFPASSDSVNATLRISFPFVETPFTGQNEILRDVEGKPLIAADNAVDTVNGELARLFRTGGSFDANAGFVSDSEDPQILGSQSVTVTAVSAVGGSSTQFQVSYTYDTSFCSSLQPRVSDILVQGLSSGTVSSVLDAVSTTKVVVIDILAGSFATGAGAYKTFFDESLHAGIEPCFVTISPSPTLSSSGGTYTVTVDANAIFSLEFSEPVNSATVLPFRTMAMTNRDDGNPSTLSIFNSPSNSAAPGYKWTNFVIGSADAAPDLKTFRFSPLLPLAKNNPALNPRTYDFHIVQGAVGIKDFAGNELNISSNFVMLNVKVSSASSTFTTEGRAFRFKASNMNEDGDTGNVSESTAAAGGVSHVQFSTDLDGGVTGRNATPYSRIVDDTQTFVKLMNVTQGGLQTPLVPLGAKMKTLWRYQDVFGGQIPAGQGGGAGPSVTDKETWHVSVVGLNWSPFGGNLFPDKFGRFKGLLGHSLYAPIARVDANNTTAAWQFSGFNDSATGGKNQFKSNALETANFDVGTTGTINAGKAGMNLADMTTVFDGSYQLLPASLFNAGSHNFVPYPDFQNFFVWRNLTYVESLGVNTGIPFLGGGLSSNEFSDSLEFAKAQLTPNQVWKLNTIGAAGGGGPSRSLPSVSLPLCMEFRCWPNAETGINAAGVNGFATSFMFNTNQGGIPNPGPLYNVQPSSRMFSQGYINQGTGAVNSVSPESSASNALTPSGGWCPANCPPTGTSPATPTSGFDPTIYWGVVNLQNIESVFFSSWVDTGDTSTVYGGFVIEPAKADLPSGTDVIVEFRGFTPGAGACNLTPQVNASRLDPYGNCDGGIPGTGGFFSGNPPTVASTYPCTGGAQPTANNSCGLTAWTTDVTTLNGKRWFQMRVRLVANSVTNIVPTLKGIGVSWN